MTVTAFDRGALIVGVVLLAVCGFLFMADSDGASTRMPTQVFPRRLLRYPIAVGASLVLIGFVGLATS